MGISRYVKNVYCSKCGVWIKKSELNGSIRCGTCNRRLRFSARCHMMGYGNKIKALKHIFID